MTRIEPSGRLDSIGLLGGTPVTVLGRGQAAEMAAEILRVVGAGVTRPAVGAYEVDLGGLAGEPLVVCDIVEEGASAGVCGGGGGPVGWGVGNGVGVWVGRPEGWREGLGPGVRGRRVVCCSRWPIPMGGCTPCRGARRCGRAGRRRRWPPCTACPWCAVASSLCIWTCRSRKR